MQVGDRYTLVLGTRQITVRGEFAMNATSNQDDERELRSRRESTVDTMASLALEGMVPTPEVLARIRSYVDGEVSLEQAITRAKEYYAPSGRARGE
jgi:hypothetical protein